jgi:hypothetical protein
MTTSSHPTPATGHIHHTDSLGRALQPLSVLRPLEATVSDLTDLLVPWFQRLRDAGTLDADSIPDDAQVTEWTAALFTDRTGSGRFARGLRARKQAPKGSTGAVRGLFGLYRWHSSGGALDGLFIARWNAGEAFDQVDTYVTVLLAASGRRSPAIEAWKRTGVIA